MSHTRQRWFRLVVAMALAVAAILWIAPALGPATDPVAAQGVARNDEVDLLARVVAAEAEGEPYAGMVGVAAVILNRVRSPEFPNTLAGVIYQPLAFESVGNGLVWRRTPQSSAYNAAWDAL